MGYQASPAGGDHMHVHAIHVGRFSLDPLLRLIDAATASLQRLRHRLEAPVEEESSDGGRKRIARDEHVEPVAAAAPKASRLRRFAIVALLLSCASGLGMAFSYKLLSQSLRTSEAVAEALRDEIAQLEKDGARLLQEKSKYQKQVYEHEKEIRALQHEVDESRGETEDLRGQVSAMKSPRGGSMVQAKAATATPGKPQAPQKTGTCTAGGANTAANLARCVEEFNRR